MLYRVMLADDEPIMRKALMTLTNWRDIGCEVVYTASNGQEVMDNLENTAPDILITDIRMPGVDGLEIARHIWENKLPVKVIILTAYADFSYAQSAVKYDVADYIVKTGLFDGLISAVERAKETIEAERMMQDGNAKDIAMENVFKSVFDSSLYGDEEIKEEFDKLSLKLGKYTVMLLQFGITQEREKRGVKEIYQSLINFLGMVFAGSMVRAIPVERDMFAIVLSSEREHFEQSMRRQSGQIIDMMDNFMKLFAYIGVSAGHERIEELKEAYSEAEYALGYGFVDKDQKINFYNDHKDREEVYPAGMELLIEQIYAEVRKGSAKQALERFDKLMEFQREQHCPAHLIKNTGILIQSRCRTILAECDKTIYEVSGLKSSVSKSIYGCRSTEAYERIMRQVIEKTAETIHIAVNKKKSLIYDCQKYIDAHFEENIMVTDIAKEIGASPSYLSRIFKELTGRTIIATLNQKKVEKAKEYLRNTDMKIYEIAMALGFDNSTYFSHFFKKYTGVSPKEYKEGE